MPGITSASPTRISTTSLEASPPSNMLPNSCLDEADAYYFVGYLNSQLQKYDEAIAALQKGLALFPNHASSEFGIARAYQRKGDSDLRARTSCEISKHHHQSSRHSVRHRLWRSRPLYSCGADHQSYPGRSTRHAVHFATQNIDALLKDGAKPVSNPGSASGPSTGHVFLISMATANLISFSSAQSPMAPAAFCIIWVTAALKIDAAIRHQTFRQRTGLRRGRFRQRRPHRFGSLSRRWRSSACTTSPEAQFET